MSVKENLEKNGFSPGDFLVSTDRLLAAAANSGDVNLARDVVGRTAKLAGVDIQTAFDFIMGRIARKVGIETKIPS